MAQTPDDGPTSIGFASPDSTQPIRDYRLPSWQWSRWTLDVDGGTSYRKRESTPRDTQLRNEASIYDVNLSLNPNYRSFWESEERRISLHASPLVSLSHNEGTQKADRDVQNTDTNYRGGAGIGGTLREYVSDRFFLLTDGDGDWTYSRSHSTLDTLEQQKEQSRTSLRSRLELNVRLGVGVGRVRIVTPVIRALRVRERLQATAPGTSLSNEQVQQAARQLAQRPGYQAVYDRPDKIFWRDFFDRAGAANRSPFETFYVADVLKEAVGVRREGAELQITPSASYDRMLERRSKNGELENRTLSTQATIGGSIRGRWYHNPSLHHQLGVDVTTEYTYFLKNEGSYFVGLQNPIDHHVQLRAEGEWLWVLADRLRLDTRLWTLLNYRRDPLGLGGFRPTNRYSLSSDLVIFVENSLRFTTGARLSYRYDGTLPNRTTSKFQANVQFGVSYVLSRALQ